MHEGVSVEALEDFIDGRGLPPLVETNSDLFWVPDVLPQRQINEVAVQGWRPLDNGQIPLPDLEIKKEDKMVSLFPPMANHVLMAFFCEMVAIILA